MSARDFTSPHAQSHEGEPVTLLDVRSGHSIILVDREHTPPTRQVVVLLEDPRFIPDHRLEDGAEKGDGYWAGIAVRVCGEVAIIDPYETGLMCDSRGQWATGAYCVSAEVEVLL